MNREQLFLDAVRFYKKGILNFQTIIDLTESLIHEDDVNVWSAGSRIIEMLGNKLENTKYYPQFTVSTCKIKNKKF